MRGNAYHCVSSRQALQPCPSLANYAEAFLSPAEVGQTVEELELAAAKHKEELEQAAGEKLALTIKLWQNGIWHMG